MGPMKDEVKKSETKETQEYEDKETVSGTTTENEIENEDRPLQIDTGASGEAKVDISESEKTVDGRKQANGKKRSSESSDGNPTPTKKIRNKPKPQIIENMQEYIENNTIEKLTTTTLLHWLKERSLHCSTRDKKAELIQKIKNHFVPIKT